MSDAPSNEASGPPRKNLSRLRAQRQARLQGSEGGSAAAEGEEGDAVPVQRQASSARPAPTAVPGRMRARDAAAPLGSSARAPLIQEDILAKREADRKKAMNAISPDDLDKTALSLADTAQFLGTLLASSARLCQ